MARLDDFLPDRVYQLTKLDVGDLNFPPSLAPGD